MTQHGMVGFSLPSSLPSSLELWTRPQACPVAFSHSNHLFFFSEGYVGKPYSESTANLVDEEVSKRVRISYENVTRLIRDNIDSKY